MDEEGAVLAGGPGALGACVEAVALLVGLERVAPVGDGAEDGLLKMADFVWGFWSL